MSDLPQAGVQLVTPGEAAFKAALAASAAAVQALGVGSAGSAAQIDKLTGRIEFQQRSLNILQQELVQTTAKYGEGSVQAQRKQLAVDKLTASITRDEKALSELKTQETAAASSSTQLGNALDKAGQSSSKFGDIMTGALRRVGEMAVNALGSAVQALGSFISTSISGAGDYEQSMNVLQSTSQATDEQMQAVKETAKALGADLTLPATSAASAGDAMLYLTQQGLSLEDSMAAAKGTLQLAAAGMVDEKEAAQTTATALNQFSLAGNDAVRVADLIAASVSASGSSVSQTGQAVQQAGTAFSSAHVPLEDFLTLVNEMSKAGIKGSDAGTSLKTMMQRLEAPTAKAAHEMEKLGVAVYDQSGAMLPMRDIIGQFSKSLTGLTQQERDQAIVTIFGSDAQRAANIVLAGGTEAYDKMKGAVTRQGAASQLAGAQMKGLNGAIAGISSIFETLALEALEPLLPMMAGVVTRGAEIAGSFTGQIGPAVQGAIGFFGQVANVIQVGFVPALAAASAITLTYAATNLPMLGIALALIVQRIILATGAFLANALAVAAAAAPYALIAAAVAGAVYAYQNLSKANQSATDQLLNSKSFWTDNTAALENYGNASAETQAKLKPLADAINQQRDALHHNIESLALRMEAGLVTEEQYQKEMEVINAGAHAVEIQTGLLNTATQAQISAQAATMTATAQTEAQTQALGENQGQIQLTEKELEELGKQLEKTFKEGSQAVQDYVSQASSFMAQLTDTSKKANDRVTADQALAYAEQAAAQRAHLGQMLSDYTLAQRQLGNITSEQADVILGAIEKQFGTTDDTSARTFLHMEQTIDRFAKNGGQSASDLAGQLGNITDTAITTKEKMDALAKKYTAELVQNFEDGRIDADEFRRALEQIPQRVNTEIHTNYTQSGNPPQHGGQQGDATGGEIRTGEAHWVGEQGRELFMPAQSGYILPHDQSMRMTSPPASAAQIQAGGGGGGGTSVTQQKVYNYAPVYAATPRAPAVDFHQMAAFGA